MTRIAIAALACAVLGCKPQALPGQSIGRYQVHGVLDRDGCGASVPSEPEIAFVVELRRSGDVGYWRLADGPVMEGQITSSSFRFETRQVVQASTPDPSHGSLGCSVNQADVVEGTLGSDDAGANAALSGATQTDLSAADGSDCAALFPTLPCTIHYALTGSRLASATR